MRRSAPPLAALLLGSLLLNVPFAFGQSLSYPDQPDYEAFRRTEIETLAALITQEDPYRALTFRLLMSQRRLREAQLMVVKEKFQLISEYSGGIPRNINNICDMCLLVGYIEKTKEIDAAIVERTVEELD